MNSAYFDTRFRCEPPLAGWPDSFAILSAHATTGSVWSPERNAAADDALKEILIQRKAWLWRVVGYSPSTSHAEPSWSTAIALSEACDLGEKFLQDALYWVERDRLFVLQCNNPDRSVFVDIFSRRIDPVPSVSA